MADQPFPAAGAAGAPAPAGPLAGGVPGRPGAAAAGAREAVAFDPLPADLRGRSLRDLGCGTGGRCLEAARRGAQRVVGLDLEPLGLGAARAEAERRGLAVEFRLADAEHAALDGPFDHVLCLGVLEWARDPLALLNRLVDQTAERLVVEVADPAVPKGSERWPSLRRALLARMPVATVGRSGCSHKWQENPRFAFSYAALENLLFFQRGVFARFGRLPAPPGRLRVAAERRRIDDLVVVAGPTGSGKSTLIETIQRGGAPSLCARLGLGDGSRWPMLSAFDIVEPQEPHLERTLFHYDTLRPFLRSAHVHARERALELLSCARRARVLTVWTPQPVLLARFEQQGKARKGRRRRAIHALFSDRERVLEHYREWFAFCAARGLEVLVVAPLEGMRCLTVEEWEREQARAAAEGRP